MSLLALTLYPEWAWAICYLGKRVENRTWARPAMVGKYLAIHGGKLIGGERDIALQELAATSMLDVARAAGAPLPEPITLRMLLEQGQGIVAVARVVRFVRDWPAVDPGKAWFCGPVGWVLDDVRVLPKPVVCRGAQGLWPVPADVLAEVREQWKAAEAVGATR